MKSYRLSVCKGPECTRGGAEALLRALCEAVAERGLEARCEVKRGGCYGLCHVGPNVVLREASPGREADPFRREDYELQGGAGEFHYAGMKASQASRLVAAHVEMGAPVAEWLGASQVSAPKR